MNQIIQKEKIENLIYEIRGKQVILASDVARLYESETKIINQVVKRNINRFPENFCFQLTKEEYISLRSQFVTLKENGRGHHIKYLPYAFTEHGIMMLSGLLKSNIAAKVNVEIINAFVVMKKYISNSLLEQKYINNLVLRHDKRIELLESAISNFEEKKNHLFFEGQIYDAYSLLIDIFSKSKNEIIIIDNYIDKNILDVLSKIKKKILLITNRYNNEDYNRYNLQYKNVKMIINNKFHDRFIIIDRKMLYHCGASFKDLGKKCFAITKLEDSEYLNKLLENINIK